MTIAIVDCQLAIVMIRFAIRGAQSKRGQP